jgi:hypothetical protein
MLIYNIAMPTGDPPRPSLTSELVFVSHPCKKNAISYLNVDHGDKTLYIYIYIPMYIYIYTYVYIYIYIYIYI